MTEDRLTLQVTLEFSAGPTGEAKLELPSEWAGQQHAEKAVAELKARTAETSLTETQSPSEKEMQSLPGTPVRISYVLVRDWDGPLNSDTRFRADLSPGVEPGSETYKAGLRKGQRRLGWSFRFGEPS